MHYIKCEYQDILLYQLDNFIYLQNSAFKEFNIILHQLRNETVHNIEELFYKYNELILFNIYDKQLYQKYKIIKFTNTEIIKILPFLKCNIFRKFINTSTEHFCSNTMSELYDVMINYLIIIILFIVLLYILFKSIFIMEKIEIHKIFNNLFKNKKRINYTYIK